MARQTLLPAELALARTEEMDPLHQELNDFINRQQIAYLNATEKTIMDKEFQTFMGEHLEEKMSNYASWENQPRGVGYEEPQTIVDDKVGKKRENRMRRITEKAVRQAGASTIASGDKEKSLRDIMNALESAG